MPGIRVASDGMPVVVEEGNGKCPTGVARREEVKGSKGGCGEIAE